MKTEYFNCFVPLDVDIIKAEAQVGKERYKNMYIQGVASTSDVDTDNEILEPNGFNLEIFKKAGLINYEHKAKDSAKNIIGEPTLAEIKDNKLVIKAKLYEKVEKARDVYDTIIAMKESGSTRKPGFSIEGQPLQRDPRNPKRITKALITHCALTFCPKNSNTFAEIIKGSQKEDFIEPKYEEEPNVTYLYKGVFGENEYTLHKDFTITKAMAATHETGQQLVGKLTSGAALKGESLDPDLKILTIPIATIHWAADNWENFKKDTKKAIRKALHNALVKARSGIYKPTAENKKKGIVGQKYGAEKKEGGEKKSEIKVGSKIRFNFSNPGSPVKMLSGTITESEKVPGNTSYGDFLTIKMEPGFGSIKIWSKTLEKRMKEKEEPIKEDKSQDSFKKITNEFDIRDALGGAISGNYKKDLAKVNKQSKKTFSEELYNEAWQNTEQP